MTPKEKLAAAMARVAGRKVDLAYYTCYPITRQWSCRWCGKALPNNRVECGWSQ